MMLSFLAKSPFTGDLFISLLITDALSLESSLLGRFSIGLAIGRVLESFLQIEQLDRNRVTASRGRNEYVSVI